MKLTQRAVWVITGLMVVALAGLVWLQYVFLMNALELKEQAFRENVAGAMGRMADRLETGEAIARVFERPLHWQQQRRPTRVLDNRTIQAQFLLSDSGAGTMTPPAAVRLEGTRILFTLPSRGHVTLTVLDLAGHHDTVVVNAVKEAGEHSYDPGPGVLRGHGNALYKLLLDSTTYMVRMDMDSTAGSVERVVSANARQAFLGKVFDRLIVAEHGPIEERISQGRLDSVVRGALTESGIGIPFAYGIQTLPSDSLHMMNPGGYAAGLQASEFRVPLFPGDLFGQRTDLVLYFPTRDLFLIRQIGPSLVAAVVFLLIIAGCFAYTIRTIIRQKTFATRLTEFINNMTHEFKTPISTVALAAEAIQRPDVIGQQEKVTRFNRIILDENIRMRGQVEKILQMAVLEEGDYELNRTFVDLHDIIRNAVDNSVLQVEARGGSVTSALQALPSRVYGDPVHLANIVHNILDNAIKYSPDAPVIDVSTAMEGGRLRVRIRDRGIGIAPAEQRRVFDKYYRVPTGNLHNVRGFGLGLSYVKLMVEAHGGTIMLGGGPGEGTTVDIHLPPDGGTS